MYSIDIKNFKPNKNENSKIKGNFTVILNDTIEIHQCKLIYSPKLNKFFVFFPSFQYDGKYYSYIKLSSSLHEKVLLAVLDQVK